MTFPKSKIIKRTTNQMIGSPLFVFKSHFLICPHHMISSVAQPTCANRPPPYENTAIGVWKPRNALMDAAILPNVRMVGFPRTERAR